ncbi:hypothetical protein D9611_000658 [Ephemerocybe angulata]|uniref:F-box domain-containing protein n=1 Tax=Ephemerocybe angulata TaxID=980116 RepID=A0A8H5BMV0_9AGAR|nr:hypothetical protein D9611_000658 [Tulosesus angulatus]
MTHSGPRHQSPTGTEVTLSPSLAPVNGSAAAVSFDDLPLDVAAHVFSLYLKQDESSTGAPRSGVFLWLGATVTPLLLTWVCDAWRRLATSLPRLWAQVCIHSPSSHQLPLLDLWFQRSRSQPLRITATLHGDSFSNRITMSTLLSVYKRWEAVDLRLRSDVENICSAYWVRGKPELLRVFAIDLGSDWTQINLIKFSAFMFSSPRLRGSCWLNAQRQCRSLDRCLWIPVTYLVIEKIDVVRLLDTLRECRQLEFLQIGSFGNLQALSSSGQPVVTLPNLKSLQLQLHDTAIVADYLTVPKLVSLTLSTGFFLSAGLGGRNPCDKLLSLLNRSQCRLESFTLGYCRTCQDIYIDNQIILTILQWPHFHNIQNLNISVVVNSPVVQALTVNDTTALLPSLRAISLGHCNMALDTVNRMCMSRMGSTKVVDLVDVDLLGPDNRGDNDEVSLGTVEQHILFSRRLYTQ